VRKSPSTILRMVPLPTKSWGGPSEAPPHIQHQKKVGGQGFDRLSPNGMGDVAPTKKAGSAPAPGLQKKSPTAPKPPPQAALYREAPLRDSQLWSMGRIYPISVTLSRT
jgi:hypothetical protein